MKKEITCVIATCVFSTGLLAGEGHSHWGYTGNEGPSNWGDLNPKYQTCKTGKTQSPIDIEFDALKTAKIGKIEFNYKDVTPEIVNNGHTIQVNYSNGSGIKVKGQDFGLAQFHFHTPSENTVEGKPYPMEMHLVHKNDSGELAVVGVFFKEGARNAELDKAWKKMPSKGGEKTMLSGVSLNAAKLLPAEKQFSHFEGSLTTPPCSEGVNWFVMEQPIEASKDQIAQFKKIIGDNARPVQPLNGRQVVLN